MNYDKESLGFSDSNLAEFESAEIGRRESNKRTYKTILLYSIFYVIQAIKLVFLRAYFSTTELEAGYSLSGLSFLWAVQLASYLLVYRLMANATKMNSLATVELSNNQVKKNRMELVFGMLYEFSSELIFTIFLLILSLSAF